MPEKDIQRTPKSLCDRAGLQSRAFYRALYEILLQQTMDILRNHLSRRCSTDLRPYAIEQFSSDLHLICYNTKQRT